MTGSIMLKIIESLEGEVASWFVGFILVSQQGLEDIEKK